jgi:hypothetical protein
MTNKLNKLVPQFGSDIFSNVRVRQGISRKSILLLLNTLKNSFIKETVEKEVAASKTHLLSDRRQFLIIEKNFKTAVF